MQTSSRRNLILNTTQIIVWAGVFLVPALVSGTMTQSVGQAWNIFKSSARMLLPIFILYCLNYYFLVPRFLYGKKGMAKWFYIVNAVLLLAWHLYSFWPHKHPDFPADMDPFWIKNMWAYQVITVLSSLFLDILLILMAVGIRYVMRANEALREAEEQRRKTAEAELTWLKSQLNPHFLFNTLNNISSLTQIDPDKAQESIGQLSDLLRYALYDSEAPKVPLASEMEFMSNYIDLMALRCNELTTVKKDLQVPAVQAEVAPLLFISLVENAFKHGVNARYLSFVDVSMHMEGERLVFRFSNSLFEKQGSDHIGSGIGLENMKRRLELLYPGKFTYSQQADDQKYEVEVTLDMV